ncbi:MAG: hypothetical protein AAF497_00500, partial [Planctomycetota bacterium]
GIRSMKSKISRRFFAVSTALALALITNGLDAQTVQLPTFRNFSVNTTVSVPDRGSASLGGVRRSSSGSTRRGVPGISRFPMAGAPFRSRAFASQSGGSQATVHATIIDHREWDAAVLAEARRRRGERTSRGNEATQEPQPVAVDPIEARARFLTLHMGRGFNTGRSELNQRNASVASEAPLRLKSR